MIFYTNDEDSDAVEFDAPEVFDYISEGMNMANNTIKS